MTLPVLLGSCFSPRLSDGTLRCGGDGSCPPGLACGDDDLCYRNPPARSSPGAPDAEARAQPEPAQDAGTSCARRPGALVCDDFEQGALDHWTDNVVSNAQLVPSQLRSHSGSWSVQAVATGTGEAKAILQHLLATPLSAGSLHLRAFMYIPSGFAVNPWIILLEMNGAFEPPYPKISADLIASERLNAVNTVVSPGSGVPSAPGLALRDAWSCIELAVSIADAGGKGSMKVLHNGTVVTESPLGIDTLPDGGFVALRFGLYAASESTQAAQIFVDDVVAATGPIGCD
jgi:hypothetical protein